MRWRIDNAFNSQEKSPSQTDFISLAKALTLRILLHNWKSQYKIDKKI